MFYNSDVTCQLCSKPFSDPRLLSCLHSFCFQCLQKETEKEGTNSCVSCPTCHKNVWFLKEGVSALPQNLRLAYEVEVAGYVSKVTNSRELLCDFCANGCSNSAVVFCCSCRKFLCKTACDCHIYVPQLLGHSMVNLDEEFASKLPAIMKPTEHYCLHTKHKQQVLDLYCNTCNCLICRDCIITVHRDHDIVELSVVAETCRRGMKEALKHAHEVISSLTRAIDGNMRMVQQIEASKHEAKLIITQQFTELIRALEERKQVLLSELETIALSNQTSLNLQKEQFEKLQQHIGVYTETASYILQSHTDCQVLAPGGLVCTELNAALKSVEGVSLISNRRSYITMSYEGRSDLMSDLSKYGRVVVLSPSPHESKCMFEPVARVNTQYCAEVETMASTGRRYPHGGLVVKAVLKHGSQDDLSVSGEVQDHGDGTYTISVTPRGSGPHQLHVTMDNLHVANSPYDLKVKGDYTTLRDTKQSISVSGKPLCVALHENGDIYVGSNDNQIYVYDQSGILKNTFGAKGQFSCPFDIFIKKDTIYVADMWNHCVQVLTTKGKVSFTLGKKGSGQGEFNGPCCVVVDSKERIIVADSGNNRVQIFNLNGNWVQTIDGSGPAHLCKSPRGLALDSQGNIYVAAFGSSIIKAFTSYGVYIKTYESLNAPRGLAVDEDGYCLVSECKGNCVSVFDPQGQMIHKVEDLHTPTGIALDPEHSCLYISSLDDSNVFKYTYAS